MGGIVLEVKLEDIEKYKANLTGTLKQYKTNNFDYSSHLSQAVDKSVWNGVDRNVFAYDLDSFKSNIETAEKSIDEFISIFDDIYDTFNVEL